MRLLWPAVLALLLQTTLAATPAKRFYDTHTYYVIEHTSHSSLASLADVLQSLGVELAEQAGELKNHWLVRTPKEPHSLSRREEHQDKVLRRFQQLKTRASSPLSMRSGEADHARRIVSSVKYLSRQELRKRVKRAPPPIRPEEMTLSRAVATRLGIQDPLFDQQWHLVNNEFPEHSMNATPVWEMGFTGKGIISSLVDDGLDYTSDDLAGNFVRSIIVINKLFPHF
jgi:kexin